MPGRARKTSQGGLKWHWESRAGCLRAGGRCSPRLQRRPSLSRPWWRTAPRRRRVTGSLRRPARTLRQEAPRAPYRTAGSSSTRCSPDRPGACGPALYEQNVAIERGGSAGAPITLSSYPGERATVRGRFRVKDSANFVTVEDLDLDGRNQRHPAEPERLRRRRRVPRTTTSRTTTHGDLLPARVERLRPRACAVTSSATGSTTAAAARQQPRPRDLHRARGRHPRDRQLDLRQRRPRRADVPRRAARVHRAQRDRRQRTGRDLLARVREQRRRAQRHLQLGAPLEHRGLGAVGCRQRRAAELRVDDAHRLVRARGRGHGDPRLHRVAEPDRGPGVRESHGEGLPPRGGQPVRGAAGGERNAAAAGSTAGARLRSRSRNRASGPQPQPQPAPQPAPAPGVDAPPRGGDHRARATVPRSGARCG